MGRRDKIIRAAGLALFLTVQGTGMQIFASPSISDLQEQQNLIVSPESTDGTNTADILSQTEIYTDRANSDEYKKRDEQGNLEDTNLSSAIDLAAKSFTEINENGKSVVEEIPSVNEILQQLDPEQKTDLQEEYGCDPEMLDQLTYMMDFKYVVTRKRVIAGEEVQTETKAVVLDNGMIEASIVGGEVIRSAQKEDYLLIQADPISEKVYVLEMKEYDPQTGDFVVDFPCVCPYMITQIMDR